MIIAVDFDGTCVTHEFPKVGRDIGAAPVLRKIAESGHKLILWTMRSNCKDNTGFSDEVPEVHNGLFLDAAVEWFIENNIPLYGVQRNPTQDSWTTSPKCYAQIYIDDAALGCPIVCDINLSNRPFVDWINVLDEFHAADYISMSPEEKYSIQEDVREQLSFLSV